MIKKEEHALRCIIADDEGGAVEILTRYVERTEGLELVGAFRDSIEALNFLADNEVELAFLDINMPQLDGMRLAGLIKETSTQVIFCTAYAEYAVESYEKGATDYLLKPISYERFRAAVDKAKKAKTIAPPSERREASHLEQPLSQHDDRKDRTIFVKSGPRLHQVIIDELLFMEKQDHYVVFHTPEGEILSRMTMSDLVRTLPTGEFVRIHRSYVVAVGKIDTIETHHVRIGDRRLPIGDSYREDLLRRIRYSGG